MRSASAANLPVRGAARTPITPETLYAAMADSTRLRTLILLQHTGERCVCELTTSLQVSQPKMSRHLAHLRDVGLVMARREGRWMHYGLAPDLPAWAINIIDCSARNLASEAPFRNDLGRWQRQLAAIRRDC